MKSLLVYLKGYGKECALSPLFKFLESAMELAVPIVVAAIIDNGIGNADKGYIWSAGGILLGCGFLGLCFAVVAQYYAAKAAMGFSKKLRHALFGHILGFSYENASRFGASTLVNRITSDVNQIQTGVNLTLRLVLRSPFIVFGALVAAFIIDVQSATIFAVAIPLLAVVVWLISGFGIPLFRRIQAKLDHVLGGVRNNLSGARVIRAFSQEQNELDEFKRINGELTAVQQKTGRLTALLNPLTYVIVNAAIILILRTGAVRVNTGDLTQGQVVALYNYMSQILIELIKLTNLIITLSRAQAGAKRIHAVFEVPTGETVTSCSKPTESAAVELRHAALTYPDSSGEALSDISFSLASGQTLGIIGGTGSGKTSVALLVMRFLDASRGDVYVNGVNVRALPSEKLREQIGYVPQHSVLFGGTIRQNLLWGDPTADDDQLMAAVRTAQCEEVLQNKGGLDAHIAQNGADLSGGQRQRLCLARALVRKPPVLIMDDSCSALDYLTESKVRSAVAELNYNPALIIISQRASSVLHAQNIMVLDDGKVVGFGPHAELLRDCEVYREIYRSQYSEAAV